MSLALYCCCDKCCKKDRLVYCALFLTGCTSKLQQVGILPVNLRLEGARTKNSCWDCLGSEQCNPWTVLLIKGCFLCPSPSALEHSHWPSSHGHNVRPWRFLIYSTTAKTILTPKEPRVSRGAPRYRREELVEEASV